MENFEEAVKRFAQLLGKKHVKLTPDPHEPDFLELTFNLDVESRIELLNDFTRLARERGVLFGTNKHLQDNEAVLTGHAVTITIPLSEAIEGEEKPTKDKLTAIAYFLDQKAKRESSLDESGARRVAVTEHDHAYRLKQLTDISWERVSNSPYGTDVIQARDLNSVPTKTRNKREFALAKKLFGEEKKAKLNAVDWLRTQAAVERDGKTPAVTAVPTEWVDHRSRVKNLLDQKGDENVSKAFTFKRDSTFNRE